MCATSSSATNVSQSPVVTELEYMLPWYAVYAFGITRIISRVVPASSARSNAAGTLTKCSSQPNQCRSSSVKPWRTYRTGYRRWDEEP